MLPSVAFGASYQQRTNESENIEAEYDNYDDDSTDLKAIEVARFMDAIAGLAPEPFDFRAGERIQMLVETIQASAREGRWLDIP